MAQFERIILIVFISLFVWLKGTFDQVHGLEAEESDETFRETLLDLNNEIRLKFGAPPLELSAKATKEAQRCAKFYANIDKIDGSCPYVKDDYGENLFRVSKNVETKTMEQLAKSAVKAWHKEEDNYDFLTGLPKNETAKYLSFTQMVWRTSTELGVGLFRKENHVFIVAFYHPPGNEEGEFTKYVGAGDIDDK